MDFWRRGKGGVSGGGIGERSIRRIGRKANKKFFSRGEGGKKETQRRGEEERSWGFERFPPARNGHFENEPVPRSHRKGGGSGGETEKE